MDSLRTNERRLPDTADCGQCFMEVHCWPESVPRSGGVEVQREPVLKRWEYLWRQGEAWRGLFLVRSGCIKQYQVTAQGEEQVLQFALPGDLLGLESLSSARCDTHAMALTDAMVCRLRWPIASAAADADRRIERRLLERASTLLRQRGRTTHSADPATALEQFLREFARRLGHADGAAAGNARRLRLPMSRLEIGQYLGCAEETVCRGFQKLQQRGVVTVSGRSVTLHATTG